MEIELNRADTFTNVSLKYTRTKNVILGIIKRLAYCYEAGIDELVKFYVISQVSINDRIQALRLKQPGIFDRYFEEYDLLTRIVECKEKVAVDEYRQRVNVLCTENNWAQSVDISFVHTHLELAKEFVRLVLRHIGKD